MQANKPGAHLKRLPLIGVLVATGKGVDDKEAQLLVLRPSVGCQSRHMDARKGGKGEVWGRGGWRKPQRSSERGICAPQSPG